MTPIFRCLQNSQFHYRRLESLKHFNVLDIYPSEHYGLSFLDLTDAIFFTRSPFFVYISNLQVHFACVLCIQRQFDGFF